MICADGNKRQKTSYREFIPVQFGASRQIDGRVCISRRVEVAFCGIGGCLLLGACKYPYGGRVGSRRVASAENESTGDYADGRRFANAGWRSVRYLLAVVSRLRARISPIYRSRGRSRSDSRMACFEAYMETPTAVGRGHEKGTIL